MFIAEVNKLYYYINENFSRYFISNHYHTVEWVVYLKQVAWGLELSKSTVLFRS